MTTLFLHSGVSLSDTSGRGRKRAVKRRYEPEVKRYTENVSMAGVICDNERPKQRTRLDPADKGKNTERNGEFSERMREETKVQSRFTRPIRGMVITRRMSIMTYWNRICSFCIQVFLNDAVTTASTRCRLPRALLWTALISAAHHSKTRGDRFSSTCALCTSPGLRSAGTAEEFSNTRPAAGRNM